MQPELWPEPEYSSSTAELWSIPTLTGTIVASDNIELPKKSSLIFTFYNEPRMLQP